MVQVDASQWQVTLTRSKERDGAFVGLCEVITSRAHRANRQGLRHCASCNVPDTHRSIKAGCDDPSSVRRKTSAHHLSAVSEQRVAPTPLSRIPNLNQIIPSRSHHVSPVWAELSVSHCAFVTKRRYHEVVEICRPDVRCAIL